MDEKYGGLIWTKHAINRLYERRIAQSDAWYTFKHPDKTLKEKSSDTWTFYKDYGQQRIEVIAKKNEKGEWVVLSCWSKIIGNKKPILPHRENFFWSLVKKIFSQNPKKPFLI